MSERSRLDPALLKRGLVAAAAVAVVGTTTAVYADMNSQVLGDQASSSGYGTDAEAASAALDRLSDGYVAASTTFRAQVQGDVTTFRNALAGDNEGSIDDFTSTFNSASLAYDQELGDAGDDFLAAVQSAASTAESKDQFIDRYNRAKADYFNRLDAAKNRFAAVVSNNGNASNVAKDQFMNSFNSQRDAYGNQLEVIKNQFADTISNL